MLSQNSNGVIETLESDSSTDSKSRKNVKVNGEARDSDVREKLTGTANEDDDDTEDSKREERKEWKRNDSEEESSQVSTNAICALKYNNKKKEEAS